MARVESRWVRLCIHPVKEEEPRETRKESVEEQPPDTDSQVDAAMGCGPCVSWAVTLGLTSVFAVRWREDGPKEGIPQGGKSSSPIHDLCLVFDSGEQITAVSSRRQNLDRGKTAPPSSPPSLPRLPKSPRQTRVHQPISIASKSRLTCCQASPNASDAACRIPATTHVDSACSCPRCCYGGLTLGGLTNLMNWRYMLDRSRAR
jgi:hypothetical protein